MAHFAEIDNNNIVIRVLVVDDLHEDDGANFLANECGLGGTWVKTSYNTFGGKHVAGGQPLRGNFAGIGMKYDKTLDAFINNQPFPSWTLNKETCLWEAPVPRPTEPAIYEWNEDDQVWISYPFPTAE